MDKQTENKIHAILDKLPATSTTKFPNSTYETGIEEVLMFLLGDIDASEFEYAPAIISSE